MSTEEKASAEKVDDVEVEDEGDEGQAAPGEEAADPLPEPQIYTIDGKREC